MISVATRFWLVVALPAALLAPFHALGGIARHYPLASSIAWGLALGVVNFAARGRAGATP